MEEGEGAEEDECGDSNIKKRRDKNKKFSLFFASRGWNAGGRNDRLWVWDYGAYAHIWRLWVWRERGGKRQKGRRKEKPKTREEKSENPLSFSRHSSL